MHSIWLLVGITALAGVGGTGMGGVIACLDESCGFEKKAARKKKEDKTDA